MFSRLSQAIAFGVFVFQVITIMVVGFFYRVLTPPAVLLVAALEVWAALGVTLPQVLRRVGLWLLYYVGLCSLFTVLAAAIGGRDGFNVAVFFALYGAPLVFVVVCCLAVGDCLDQAERGP